MKTAAVFLCIGLAQVANAGDDSLALLMRLDEQRVEFNQQLRTLKQQLDADRATYEVDRQRNQHALELIWRELSRSAPSSQHLTASEKDVIALSAMRKAGVKEASIKQVLGSAYPKALQQLTEQERK